MGSSQLKQQVLVDLEISCTTTGKVPRAWSDKMYLKLPAARSPSA